MLRNVLEFTFWLIILYLVIANYRGFAQIVASFASAYTQVVRALQGR